MCQSLVAKVTRQHQLTALADAELLVLFEDWLEELEKEAIAFVKKSRSQEPSELAQGLGLSPASAASLMNRLKKAGRL